MTTDPPLPVATHHKKQQSDRFFELSLDLMCVVGFDGCLQQVNPMWTHLLGWTEAELVGQPALNIVHPDDHALLRAARAEVREGRELGRVEIRYRHKDGSYRWIWWNVFPQYEDQTIYAIGRNITEQKRNESLRDGQKKILEMVAMGRPLTETLNALLNLLEHLFPDMRCSILLVDPDGMHLSHGAAPNLPTEYYRAIDGSAIGPTAGSCGTAAFRREAVIVEDIALDPLWVDYRRIALAHGLRACWSTPIFDSAREVLGTFAIYYDKPGRPAVTHLNLVEIATQIAAIAISRQRDETALQLSRNRYRRLIESGIIGVMIADTEGHISEANDAFLHMVGYSRAELEAGVVRWNTLTPPEYRAVDEYIISELQRCGSCAPVEKEYLRKDGSRLPVLASVTLLDNSTTVGLCLVEDLTERKRTEAALRDSEARYRRIVETSAEGIWTIDTANRTSFVNRQMAAMLGYQPEEMLGHELFDFMDIPTRDHVEQRLAHRRQGISEQHEFCLRHRDGREVWTYMSASPLLDATGLYTGSLAMVTDITERKRTEMALQRSEYLLRLFVEHSPASIAMFDRNMHYLQVSNQYLSDFHLTGKQQVIGRCHYDVFPEIPEHWKAIHRRCLTGVVESCAEDSFQRSDGSIDWVRWEIHPWHEDNGEVGGIILFVELITERKRTEMELRTSEEKFTTVFRDAPIWIAITDMADGTYLDVNEYALRAAGFSRNEVIGRTAAEVGWLKPNERQLFLDEITRHGKINGMEMTFHNRSGEMLHGWVTGKQITINNRSYLLTVSADITERKRAENALRERENYLDKIINNIGDPFFVKDDQYRMVLVNDAFCALFNLPRDQIIGKTLAEQTPPEQREHFWRIDKLVLTEGHDNVCEELLTIRDGEPQTISTRKTRYMDDAGNKFVIGVIHDITEAKRMEAALRSSEARLQGIFSAMAEGLVVQELDGSLVECNRAAEEILGLNIDQMSGRAAVDPHWQSIHEDGSVFPAAMHPSMVVLKTGQPARDVIMGVRKPDNSLVWISINAVPLSGPDTKMIGAVCTFSDITASVLVQQSLKQSEASLAAAQARAKIGNWELDLTTQTGTWSAEMFRLFCRDPALGAPSFAEFIQLVHPDERESLLHDFNKAIATKRGFNREFRVIWTDGAIRWIEGRGELLMDDAGMPAHVVGTSQDITERKHLEAQLRQAQKMEAVGTLAGGIAHDFNNILAAIKGYTQLAKADAKNRPDLQEHLDAVLQGAYRATELVRQITTFSRQHETQRSPLQLQKIVAEALVLLRATIPTTVEIKSALDRNAPAVLADPTQIHQVVMNLCTNAWHAMKSRPGQLELRIEGVEVDATFASLHTELQPGKHVRLTVTDNGSGMDQTTLARIFEPFFTTKAPGEGSGLGLAVVHGIVRSHHGTIVVNSRVQAGTTFELYFPALADNTVNDTVTVREDSPHSQGERLLLVDDEPALVHLGTRILERFGYTVNAFANSHEALNAVRTSLHEFDLVITDLSMPVMSGLDLAEELRRIRPDIPIIVISGYVDNLTQQRITAMGIQKVLLKPFTVESLGVAVHQILSAKSRR